MLFDKVLETSTTTGTGTLNLAGAPAGYRTFVAAAGSGNQAFYHIQDRADSTIWEAGYGTVTDASPDTLTRNLLASSTGSLINWSAGTRDVYSYSAATALASVLKGHISATGRQAWLQAGATWVDSSATPWVWYAFDGTDNIQIATINATTNVLTLSIAAATTTASGIVELATSAETITGTDATRAVTAAGVLATRSLVVGINTQTDSYTLVLADAGKVVEIDKATAVTLTVPLNNSVAFPTNTKIDLVQRGAGQMTIAATGGVTIRSSAGKLKLFGQHSGATVYKRGTDEWVLIGDLVV